MQFLFRSGRYLLAIAVIAFGMIEFASEHFLTSFLPLPDSFPARHFLIGLISTLFVGAGIGMIINKTAYRFAFLSAFLFFLFVLYPNLPKLLADLHNGGEWTVIGELAALGSGGLILAGIVTQPATNAANTIQLWYTCGRIIFSLCLLIFGILHFVYADYIATLIPEWIPFRLFWSYFVGVAFIAGFLGILTNVKIQLAASLLGFMFLFWVLFLHLPRVMAKSNVEPEWTSLFNALGFCGIFFMLARNSGKIRK